MLSNRKAFTLIELLVVIAIIAILAAILFPVFAQAKEAAKKTLSLSNIKQVTLSQFLYMQDFDDTIAMNRNCNLVVNGVGGQFPCVNGRGYLGWIDLVVPYVKNYGVFKSQSDGVPANLYPAGLESFNGERLQNGIVWNSRPNDERFGGEYRSSYARNNNFANNGTYTSNVGAVTNPSSVILVYSFAANSGGGAGGGEGVPGSTFSIVRRPEIFPAAGTCTAYDNASTGNNRANFFFNLPAYAQVRERAKPSSERYNGVANYGFADGHAKAYKPDQIKGQCQFGFTPIGTETGNGGTPDFRF